MLTDNEVMTIVLEYLLRDASNETYKEKLNIILEGIRGKKHIEEQKSPRYQSILLFGFNIFTFSIAQYRAMVEVIDTERGL
jgi:hypothetical protein